MGNNPVRSLYPVISGFLLLLSIGVFYYLAVKYSINIPWFDDIENIPYFLIRWIEAPTLAEKWQTIIYPNNEHRVLTARLIVLLQYWSSQKLNFRILNFLGNTSLLFLFGFISYSFVRQSGKWFLIVPIAFLIFNFQSYAGTFMTIMSLQYQMVILLSVAVFYFLAKGGNVTFLVAILLAYLDTFSMGNGMMVWPAGMLLLLFQVRWKELAIWITTAVIAVFLYFYGHDFVQGNDRAFDYILQYPLRTFIAFFTMLGGDFDVFANAEFSRRMIIPTISGFILFAVFIIWFLVLLGKSPYWSKRIPKKVADLLNKNQVFDKQQDSRWNAFWLGIFIYVFISMILVVVFRTRFDPHIILWSTYKMYPAVLTSVAYIVVIQVLKGKAKYIFFIGSLLVSGAVWASTITNYLPLIKQTSLSRTAFAYNQKKNGIGLGATKDSPFEKMLANTLNKVDSMQIYSLPYPLIHTDEDNLLIVELAKALAKIDVRRGEGNNLFIRQVSVSEKYEKRYVILQSSKNTYLFAISQNHSEAVCPLGTIRDGVYKIGIWLVNKNDTRILPTNQEITIP